MSLAAASILAELILVALLLLARQVWLRRTAVRAMSDARDKLSDRTGVPVPFMRRAEPGDLLPALFVDTRADWAVRDEPDNRAPALAPLELDASWRLMLPPDDEPSFAPAPASSRPTALSCTIARLAQERA